jgi:spore germination protein (amino acid permease)
MSTSIPERYQVSPFFVFFLVHANVVGVGILRFQQDIIQHAGYDAWISIILVGLSIHAIVWMMYRLLNDASFDMIHLHTLCFGKWLGRLASLLVILYLLTAAVVVFRSYLEVVKIYLFPWMQPWSISVMILLIVYYVVTGGFRTVTGICFFGVVIPLIFIIPLFIFPFEYAHFTNIMPILSHSTTELLLSSREAIFSFLGFEVLFFYYPFIREPVKSQKWAHFAILFSTILYISVAVITFVFFTEGELKRISWPTITMIKIIEVPIIQRIEFIIISLWLLVVLPNICLSLWAVSRGFKQLFNINQRATLLFLLVVMLVFSLGWDRHIHLMEITKVYSQTGMYLVYAYVPLLFLLYQVIGKGRKRQMEKAR